MRLLEVGADLKFAQARFGHANIQSTAIYAELVTPAFHCSRYGVLEDES
jgi:site-specific recombinase XerD